MRLFPLYPVRSGTIHIYLACIVPKVLGRRRAVLTTPIALVDLCHWLEGYGPVIRDGRGNDNGGAAIADVDGVLGG